MAMREAAKCLEGIIHLDAIERRMAPSACDDRCCGAFGRGLRQIVVAVSCCAWQRDEQSAGLERARVDADAADVAGATRAGSIARRRRVAYRRALALDAAAE